jgi:DNA-binding transcriptional MerR regulator
MHIGGDIIIAITQEVEMQFYKIRDICRILGIPDYKIYYLLRHGRISEPSKDSSGDFVFTESDILRIKEAMQQSAEGVVCHA